MNTIFQQLELIREKKGCVSLALIDPDSKNDLSIDHFIETINEADFDAILLGGSLIMDHYFDERAKTIKKYTNKPVILFPGSSDQINQYTDAVLLISLLSGRNPQYLIGEHIQSAPKIYSLKLEVIPTGYLLLDGGIPSSVAIMSKTSPLPMEKHDIIAAHALAGQYLGMKMIFLEAGSGALNSVSPELINYINNLLDIPIMVGGGIKTPEAAREIVNAGAGYVVIGTAIENGQSKTKLKEINQVIHG